jgi:hypothetical protein
MIVSIRDAASCTAAQSGSSDDANLIISKLLLKFPALICSLYRVSIVDRTSSMKAESCRGLGCSGRDI